MIIIAVAIYALPFLALSCVDLLVSNTKSDDLSSMGIEKKL